MFIGCIRFNFNYYVNMEKGDMMTYIYDVLLNFNEDYFEFYEWEKSDKIYHIKKIPIFKVDIKVIEDFISKKIELNDIFLNTIMNKTEVYENKKIKNLKYSCLLTDSYKVIGINIINKNVLVSDLLLDEAYDVISISDRINLIKLEYNILSNREFSFFETRRELIIKKELIKELTNIYNEKDINKLQYLYFEFFSKNENKLEIIYEELINSLNCINNNHIKLLNLIKLCNKKDKYFRISSNLTNR